MDGVLVDLESKMFETYRADFPDAKFLDPSKRRGLYMDKQYKQELGKEAGERIYKILCRSGFFYSASPLTDAVVAFQDMCQDDRFEVFICTSPLTGNPTCASDKLRWVKDFIGPQYMKRAIITSDKTVVNGHYLIDDKVDITGAEDEPQWKHVLCRTRYNSHVSSQKLKSKIVLETGTKEGTASQWPQIKEMLIDDFACTPSRKALLSKN